MADSYHIIDGKVVPYRGGRKCNDTDAWRDATQLELQLQEQLEEHEHTIAALRDDVERLIDEATQHLRQAMSNGAKARAAYAEIEKLRAENEAMKRCAIKYLGWLGVTHMPLDQALYDDMCNPSMCGDAALSKENRND